VEYDRVLELRILLESIHDRLEVLVVRCICHGDKLSRRTNVPPEVSRLVDDVQDILGVFHFGELRQGVLDDVVSSTQSSEVGANDNDVTRFRHDGEALVMCSGAESENQYQRRYVFLGRDGKDAATEICVPTPLAQESAESLLYIALLDGTER